MSTGFIKFENDIEKWMQLKNFSASKVLSTLLVNKNILFAIDKAQSAQNIKVNIFLEIH